MAEGSPDPLNPALFGPNPIRYTFSRLDGDNPATGPLGLSVSFRIGGDAIPAIISASGITPADGDYLFALPSSASVDLATRSGSVFLAEGALTESIDLYPVLDDLAEGEESVELVVVSQFDAPYQAEPAALPTQGWILDDDQVYVYRVEFAGDGSGSVALSDASGGALDCASACSYQSSLSRIQLSPQAAPDSRFLGWSDCAATPLGDGSYEVSSPSSIDVSEVVCSAVFERVTCPATAVLYVNAGAVETGGSGSSWNDPVANLQEALARALICPEVRQIWVAQGVYTPGTQRGDSFKLLNRVEIYGGFVGDETSVDQRDPANETILSGELGEAGVYGDNSIHVVDASGTDSSAVLDTVKITGGYADVSGGGGGIFIRQGSPTLRALSVYDNYATLGGGLSLDGGNPRVEASYFYANSALGGGAVYVASGAPVFRETGFEQNLAGDGGALYNANGNPLLVRNYLVNNRAEGDGGALYNAGGSLALSHSKLDANLAQNGGALYNAAGISGLSNTLLAWNEAGGVGGAVLNAGGDLRLSNVTLSGNRASLGGGVVNQSGVAGVDNSILWANQDDQASPGLLDVTGLARVNASLLQGGWSGSGSGNIDADPLFADGGFNLAALSPALDAGEVGLLALDFGDAECPVGDGDNQSPVSVDLACAPRLSDGDGDGVAQPDMGALEAAAYQPIPQAEIAVGLEGLELFEPPLVTVDFGVTELGLAVVKRFTVFNLGEADLSVSVSLPLPAGYSLLGPDSALLAAGFSAEFEVRLDAVLAGNFSGVLEFLSNDPDEAVFRVPLQATVSPPPAPVHPELAVFSAGGGELQNGDSLNFGVSTGLGLPLSQSLLLVNQGQGELSLSLLELSPGFSLLGELPPSLAAGARVSVWLRWDALSGGTARGVFSLDNNDADDHPFVLNLLATLQPPPVVESHPPEQLLLSKNWLFEQQAPATLVGQFSSLDPDPEDSHVYRLVPGAGDTGNAAFRILGDLLLSAAVLDSAAQDLYSIRVETRDSADNTLEDNFQVRVVPLPGVALSNNVVAENRPPATWVGDLAVTAPQPGVLYRFDLVSGPGDLDNFRFAVADAQLLTQERFDYEQNQAYQVRVGALGDDGSVSAQAYLVYVQPQSVAVSLLRTGWKHTCALRSDASVQCWGWNNYLQSQAPAEVADFISLSAGSNHNCGLRADGGLRCWGDNESGQATPPGGDQFTAVSAGGNHSCGLRRDGVIQCWGYNFNRQTEAPADLRFRAVSAGGFHTCGILQDGGLHCWGWDNFGQARPPQGRDFVELSSGEYHSCALRVDGSATCWGKNHHGQTAVPPELRLRSVSAGEEHSCGVSRNGGLACWGGNAFGQSQVPRDTDFVQVSAGGHYTCAVREDASAQCWGRDSDGQGSPPLAAPNYAPHDLQLDTEGFIDTAPGSVVGRLSTLDPDPADAHLYRLVAGVGDADNALFRVEGTNLVIAEALDPARDEYRVRLEVDDQHNGKYTRSFVLSLGP